MKWQNQAVLNTPVLFIIFNRPDTTQLVFNEIRKAKPKTLYVAADGPRLGNKDDQINSQLARNIVKQVDWECDLRMRFLDENLGCGYGVSSAITWVFENEESAIILEDDCKPSKAFFYYCQEMLEKYKNDEEVWMVSGDNYTEEFEFSEDYAFSGIAHHIWGWATWKRAWNNFDISKEYYQKMIKSKSIKELYKTKRQGEFFENVFARFYKNDIVTHTWDYQWLFIISSNEGLTVVPRRNLVTNIGIIGAHTGEQHDYHNREIDSEFSISKYPEVIKRNDGYDNLHFINHWKKMGKSPFYKRVYKKLKKTFSPKK